MLDTHTTLLEIKCRGSNYVLTTVSVADALLGMAATTYLVGMAAATKTDTCTKHFTATLVGKGHLRPNALVPPLNEVVLISKVLIVLLPILVFF